MSRCYPFPPPGFVPNRVRDESLVEPIKKGTKDEVKREKKDRKHHKDKKRKDRNSEDGRSRKHKRQRKDYEIANASKKVECLEEEKSCLTMEPENQSSFSENEGPESRQPLNGRHNDSETRIDKGPKYPEVMMMTNKDQKQCCSRDSLDSSHAALYEYGEKEETNRRFSMQLGKEKGVASSHQESIIGSSNLCSKCPPSTAMRFSKLIENWAPDRFETKLADFEDEELWLLMKVGAKRHDHQVSVQTSSKGSSSMVWEAAQFLPEAGLHALPFTVPF